MDFNDEIQIIDLLGKFKRLGELTEEDVDNLTELLMYYNDRIELVKKYDELAKVDVSTLSGENLENHNATMKKYEAILEQVGIPEEDPSKKTQDKVYGYVYLSPKEIEYFGTGISVLNDLFINSMISRFDLLKKKKNNDKIKVVPNNMLKNQNSAIKKLRKAYDNAWKQSGLKNNLNKSKTSKTYYSPKFISVPLSNFTRRVIEIIHERDPEANINIDLFTTFNSGVAHIRLAQSAFWILRQLMPEMVSSPDSKTKGSLSEEFLQEFGIDTKTMYQILTQSGNEIIEFDLDVDERSPIELAESFDTKDFQLITWASVTSKGMLSRENVEDLLPNVNVFGAARQGDKDRYLQFFTDKQVKDKMSRDGEIDSLLFRSITKEAMADRNNLVDPVGAFYDATLRVSRLDNIGNIDDFCNSFPNSILKYTTNLEYEMLRQYNQDLNERRKRDE